MRYIFAFLLSLVALSGVSQTLYIYHFKGNVTYTKDRGKPLPLQNGVAIEKGITLNIPEGGNVFVLNQAGLAVAISKAGKYTHDKVAAEVKKSTDVASPFFAHVWKKLREHHGHDPASLGNAPKGGVSRGEWEVYELQDTVIILSNAFLISWRPVSDNTYFTLTDASGKKKMKLSLADTSLTVYPYEMQLQRGQYFQWKLSKDLAGLQSISGVLYLPTQQWLDRFKKEEQQIIEATGKSEDTVFSEFQLLYFYYTKKVQ